MLSEVRGKRRWVHLPWLIVAAGATLLALAIMATSVIAPAALKGTTPGSQLLGRILFAQPPYTNQNNKVHLEYDKGKDALKGHIDGKKECKPSRTVNINRRYGDPNRAATFVASTATNGKGEFSIPNFKTSFGPGFYEAEIFEKSVPANNGKTTLVCEHDRSNIAAVGTKDGPAKNRDDKVTIQYDKKKGQFSGHIDDSKECKPSRDVVVWKEGPSGPTDTAIGGATTNDKGEWTLPYSAGPGFYWAYVSEVRDRPKRICEDDASKAIEVK